MKRKICIATGTRAEYGLLRWVMAGLRDDPDVDLQVIATGMHLAPKYGSTYREIEADGFTINQKIEILNGSDTPVDVSMSMSLAMSGFAKAFSALEPDLLLILGDRYEIFCAAIAAMVAQIPIAHIHGGEATEGLIDEAIRHSITKMSHFHYVAAEEYRQRVIQMGENPNRVFLVGGLGVDSISKINLMSRVELESSLGFKFGRRNLLVTFHPVTLEKKSAAQQMQQLLNALHKLEDTHVVFTLPNADTGAQLLIKMIEKFVEEHPNTISFPSLGQRRYLSCIAQVDGVIGNSSSGLIEVPTLGKGTVNIGDRQMGRLRAKSVIDCGPTEEEILAALRRLYEPEFCSLLKSTINPYGRAGASQKIISSLKRIDLQDVLKKHFYDITFQCV